MVIKCSNLASLIRPVSTLILWFLHFILVHVIFSKSNMRKGAVWNEDLQEEVIPSDWISDKTVCRLPGTKALTALKCREELA